MLDLNVLLFNGYCLLENKLYCIFHEKVAESLSCQVTVVVVLRQDKCHSQDLFVSCYMYNKLQMLFYL